MTIKKILNIMKKKSIKSKLEKKYGGNWIYMPFYGWYCEEKNMNAYRTVEGYDMNGNPLPTIFNLIRVYGNGKNGEIFFP